MRALVLGGAGAVCKETTRDLAAFSAFSEIVIADSNREAVDALIADLGDERLASIPFDARDQASMLRIFPEYDVVVNGLPFQFDYPVNKACAECGVSGLDISSEEQQFALHDLAASKGALFVPGMGATPGITNMMARRAAEVLDEVVEIEVYFAAFRCLAPAPGLLQTTLWEFNPEIPDREKVFFEDGELRPAPPLSGEKTIRFHEQIGDQRVYYVPHPEPKTFPGSFPGLRRAAVRGCFPPHVMETMAALTKAGLLSNRTVYPGKGPGNASEGIASIEAVRALLAESPFSRDNPVWAYGLVVEALGKRDGTPMKAVYRSRHPPQEAWGGPSAYYKNVGIPLSIGAQLIAAGLINGPGVLPPELAFPTRPFFEALAIRGITVEEMLVRPQLY